MIGLAHGEGGRQPLRVPDQPSYLVTEVIGFSYPTGSMIEAGEYVGFRHRQTQMIRWDADDEPIVGTANQL